MLNSSKRKPILFGTDDGKEFVSKTFTNPFFSNKFKKRSKHISLGVVFGEIFSKTFRDFLKKLVFEKQCC